MCYPLRAPARPFASLSCSLCDHVLLRAALQLLPAALDQPPRSILRATLRSC